MDQTGSCSESNVHALQLNEHGSMMQVNQGTVMDFIREQKDKVHYKLEKKENERLKKKEAELRTTLIKCIKSNPKNSLLKQKDNQLHRLDQRLWNVENEHLQYCSMYAKTRESLMQERMKIEQEKFEIGFSFRNWSKTRSTNLRRLSDNNLKYLIFKKTGKSDVEFDSRLDMIDFLFKGSCSYCRELFHDMKQCKNLKGRQSKRR
jgi:hypothetical protein